MDIPSILFGMIAGSLITAAGFVYYFVIKVAKESRIKDPTTTPSKR
jgi:hypothetical protein